jgi:hypothetical protein
MRPSRGVWEKMVVKGHHPDELWQKYKGADGNGQAWSAAHYGEVIEMQNGMPINIGKCKVCGGKMQVGCSSCKGSSKAQCTFCRGLKIVPESANWTPAPPPDPPSAPKLSTKPTTPDAPVQPAPKVATPLVPTPSTKPQTRFELKDGRILVGYKSMVVGNFVNIRTEKGNVEVDGRDIVKEEALPGNK